MGSIMMWTPSLVVLGLLVNFIHMKHYLIETENMEGNSGRDYTYKGKTKGYETKGYKKKDEYGYKTTKGYDSGYKKTTAEDGYGYAKTTKGYHSGYKKTTEEDGYGYAKTTKGYDSGYKKTTEEDG